jgi:glycosyltransferase involved in cell wall biosynthesis
VVYQLGNASCHDYTWPYLVRFPGLVVLHDGRIHHARARALVARHRYDDYRAEFRFNQPDADPTFAEYAINGFAASLYYFWPFRRAVVAAARAVAVHSPDLVADLRAECPEVAVTPLRQGLRGPVARPTPIWQPSKPGIVFGAYGLVTPAKRVPQILRAFASTFRHADGAHLLLAGDQTVYYDARADAAALGIADRVTIAGYVPDQDLDAWIHAADVCLCLRWPTAGETSGPWIRALGAGKPTVITALRQYLHVPTVDARTGTIVGGGPDPTAPVRSWREAVAVSVDLVDEDAALALALRRLFSETALREALGRNARGWWERHHAPALMAADYREAIAHALSRPARPAAPPGLPPHLLEDGGALTRALTAACGVEVDIVENPGK